MGVGGGFLRTIYKCNEAMQQEKENNKYSEGHLFRIWMDAGDEAPLPEEQVRTAYRRTERRMTDGAVRKVLWACTRVAAVLFIPVALLAIWALFGKEQASEVRWAQVYVPKGEKMEIVLPDSSHIWLNSDSYMVYPDRFSGDERKVFLCGEAFADISHDSSRPFVMETQCADVKVFGTRFNVKSYADDGYTETRLVEGSVAVSFGSQEIMMKPGEQLTVDHSTMTGNLGTFDADGYHSWHDGTYLFRDNTLEEIIRYLERIFDKRILICDSSLLDNRYFVVFSSSMTIEEMLAALDIKSEMKIENKGDVIEIHAR